MAKRRRDKFGGQYVAVMTPEKTVNYEALITLCAQQAMAGREPLQGAVAVDIGIYVQIPASWSKRKQEDALAGRIRPTGKPDTDNVIKAIFDGCNGVCWRDDAQVTDIERAVKRYSITPRIEMVVRAID